MIFWIGFTVMVLNEGFVIMRHVSPWFAKRREELISKFGDGFKKFFLKNPNEKNIINGTYIQLKK